MLADEGKRGAVKIAEEATASIKDKDGKKVILENKVITTDALRPSIHSIQKVFTELNEHSNLPKSNQVSKLLIRDIIRQFCYKTCIKFLFSESS